GAEQGARGPSSGRCARATRRARTAGRRRGRRTTRAQAAPEDGSADATRPPAPRCASRPSLFSPRALGPASPAPRSSSPSLQRREDREGCVLGEYLRNQVDLRADSAGQPVAVAVDGLDAALLVDGADAVPGRD